MSKQQAFIAEELVYFFSLLQIILVFSLWQLVWKDLKACSEWLNKGETDRICFGSRWHKLHPKLDYGAEFSKEKDSKILCLLQAEVELENVELKCE